MLKQIFNQVRDALTASDRGGEDESSADRSEAVRMATAVLMVDVARADHLFDETEFDRLLELIQQHFELTADAAATLVNSANDKADDLVSLHHFTDLLHAELSHDEKAQVVSLLWQTAYADGRLDQYEDSLVLKISDLLHVSRGRVMRLKHDAGKRAATTN